MTEWHARVLGAASRRRLLLASGTAIFALIAESAVAQTPGAETDVEEVVVTGSRVIRSGAEAPTPVTVLDAQQMLAIAPQNLADSLNQLPAFKGSISPQNTGSPSGRGGNRLNMRNLGSNRVLILLDGRRHVPAQTDATVDTDILPQALVRRVDVVTGGASAAYGSDAVSGVVNFILDTRYTGLKVDAKAGQSERGDNFFYSTTVTYGTSFANDRGHIVVNFEHYDSDGIAGANSGDRRPWQKAQWQRIPNVPSGTAPATVTRANVNLANGAYGGLITTTALAGTTFDPGGIPRPFQFGELRSASYMVGGEHVEVDTALLAPLKRNIFFSHVTFELTPTANLYAEVSIGETGTRYLQTVSRQAAGNAYYIFQGNPYIPASVAATLATTPFTTAQFNTCNAAANVPNVGTALPGGGTQAGVRCFRLGRYSYDFGQPTNVGSDELRRGIVGLKGELGTWSYDAYYQYGKSTRGIVTENNYIVTRTFEAADAVIHPTTGQIVCQTSIANPNNGCVPLNLFGAGSPSQAAVDYAVGTTENFAYITQQVAALSFRGDLFSLPAGPISTAFGAEYREDVVDQQVDPISDTHVSFGAIRGGPPGLVGQVGGYGQSNPQKFKGENKVKEVFFEAAAPLVKDLPLAKQIELNAAVRATNYSTSGTVTTWKAGLVYQVVDSFRIRATRSRDIRAPAAEELFSPSDESRVTVIDRFRNNLSGSINVNTLGNPNLDPEEADTTTIGVVFQPTFLPTASLSLDYYEVDLQGAIQTLGAQVTIDQCFGGATSLCANIIRASDGSIGTLNLPFLNISSRVISGFDMDASYTVPLDNFGGGDITFRGILGYSESDTITVPGASTVERAGAISPQWTGVFSATFRRGPFTFIAQHRYVGKKVFSNQFEEGVDIDENDIPKRSYIDLSARYVFENLGKGVELYGTINNFLDTDPPIVPSNSSSGTSFRGTDFSLYDVVGRAFTVGVKVAF